MPPSHFKWKRLPKIDAFRISPNCLDSDCPNCLTVARFWSPRFQLPRFQLPQIALILIAPNWPIPIAPNNPVYNCPDSGCRKLSQIRLPWYWLALNPIASNYSDSDYPYSIGLNCLDCDCPEMPRWLPRFRWPWIRFPDTDCPKLAQIL